MSLKNGNGRLKTSNMLAELAKTLSGELNSTTGATRSRSYG